MFRQPQIPSDWAKSHPRIQSMGRRKLERTFPNYWTRKRVSWSKNSSEGHSSQKKWGRKIKARMNQPRKSQEASLRSTPLTRTSTWCSISCSESKKQLTLLSTYRCFNQLRRISILNASTKSLPTGRTLRTQSKHARSSTTLLRFSRKSENRQG